MDKSEEEQTGHHPPKRESGKDKKNNMEEALKMLSILEQAEEIISMGCWEYEINSRKLTQSKGLQKILNIQNSKDITPDFYINKALPASKPAAERIVEKITVRFEPFEETVQLIINGSVRIITVKATVLKADQGKPIKMIGVAVDITEEHSKSEIISIMSESLFQVDNNWVVKYINQAALNFWAIDRTKIEGKSFWSVFPELIGTPFHRSMAHTIEAGKASRKEFFLNPPSRWIYTSFTPYTNGLIVLFTDIQSKKNAAEKLRENRERLSSIIGNTPDVITRWDLNHRLIFANHAFVEKTGISISDSKGKTIKEMVQAAEIAETYMYKLDVVIHTGMPTDYFNYLPLPEGKRYLYSRLVPEYDNNGNVVSVLSIGTDITELKKIQEELLEKNKQLIESQQSHERKDDFIHLAGHELKTPITSLKIYAQLLLKKMKDQKDIDPFILKGLTTIDRQVSSLIGLINELLDISKINNPIELEIEAFDLCELIEETIAFTKPTAKHELLFFGKRCLVVAADRQKINQVFTNLLTNAIKYSPKAGKVEIVVSAADGYVTVSVKDYGIGIAKEFHNKIFERFYRVDKSNKEKVSGLGIGLYISQEIIQKHGGKIWVESSEGSGSAFIFSLPVYEPPDKIH